MKTQKKVFTVDATTLINKHLDDYYKEGAANGENNLHYLENFNVELFGTTLILKEKLDWEKS